jgi:hypothetical protein
MSESRIEPGGEERAEKALTAPRSKGIKRNSDAVSSPNRNQASRPMKDF